MTARLWLVATIALAISASSPLSASGASSGLVIEIDESQRVSVQGQAPSLATLVAEVCARAGVTLRGYEARDRPISVAYESIPLRDALQRMLRDETYMIGVRAGDGGKRINVAWVHVTGSTSAGAPASPAAATSPLAATPPAPPPAEVPPSMTGFGLPAGVVSTALTSQNDAERRDAVRTLAEHVDTNPGLMDQFLAREIAGTIDELAAYPFSREALQTIAIRQKDPVKRAKIDAIVKAIMVRAGGPKKPSFAELMQQGGMPH
jgi:hypothetical protein